MKAIFNAKYYYEAGSFTDTETGGRYAIGCVRVEPHPVKGVLIVATEGHVLGLWHDEHGECVSPVLINCTAEARGACGMTDNEWEQPQSRLMRINDDDSVTILSGRGTDFRDQVATFYGLISADEYPDWRNVLPTEETPRMDINPRYVDLFSKLNKSPHHTTRLALWISPFNGVVSHGKTEPPAVVKVEGRNDFVGVVMGMMPQDTEWPKDTFDVLRNSK